MHHTHRHAPHWFIFSLNLCVNVWVARQRRIWKSETRIDDDDDDDDTEVRCRQRTYVNHASTQSKHWPMPQRPAHLPISKLQHVEKKKPNKWTAQSRCIKSSLFPIAILGLYTINIQLHTLTCHQLTGERTIHIREFHTYTHARVPTIRVEKYGDNSRAVLTVRKKKLNSIINFTILH